MLLRGEPAAATRAQRGVLAVLGAIFVLVVMFMPHGLVPGFRQLWERFAGKSGDRPAARATEAGP